MGTAAQRLCYHNSGMVPVGQYMSEAELDAQRTMPKIDGKIIHPCYLPEHQQKRMLIEWQRWCDEHPKDIPIWLKDARIRALAQKHGISRVRKDRSPVECGPGEAA